MMIRLHHEMSPTTPGPRSSLPADTTIEGNTVGRRDLPRRRAPLSMPRTSTAPTPTCSAAVGGSASTRDDHHRLRGKPTAADSRTTGRSRSRWSTGPHRLFAPTRRPTSSDDDGRPVLARALNYQWTSTYLDVVDACAPRRAPCLPASGSKVPAGEDHQIVNLLRTRPAITRRPSFHVAVTYRPAEAGGARAGVNPRARPATLAIRHKPHRSIPVSVEVFANGVEQRVRALVIRPWPRCVGVGTELSSLILRPRSTDSLDRNAQKTTATSRAGLLRSERQPRRSGRRVLRVRPRGRGRQRTKAGTWGTAGTQHAPGRSRRR